MLLTVSCVGMIALWNVNMENFFIWILWAVATFLMVGAVTLLFGMVTYREELKQMIQSLLTGKKKS